jgi:Domain of unknown function (DUF4157)
MGKSGWRIYKWEDENVRKKTKLKKQGEQLEGDAYLASLTPEEVQRTLDEINARLNRAMEHVALSRANRAAAAELEIHAKLEISTPEDAHEKQADEFAESVAMNKPEQSTQISKKQVDDVSTKSEGESGLTTSPDFDSKLQSTKGQGEKMDETVKAKLESHTGTDLSGVNVHTGSTANELSKDINAKAFAHGQDIYFKEGQYNPQSAEGEKLLSHETMHTLQNGGQAVLHGEGVERKLMRQVVDPKTKKEFKLFEPPKEFEPIRITGLRVDNSVTSLYERILSFGHVVKATMYNDEWYYAEFEGKTGYIKIEDLIAHQTVSDVKITNDIYDGDLEHVADKIKLWYDQTQQNNFWGDLSSGMDLKREQLLQSIPENLGFEQREKLKEVLEFKYNLSLENILYIGFQKDMAYKDNPELFKALFRVNEAIHTEIGNLKLIVPENNVIAKGAEPTYRVQLGGYTYSQYNLPPVGMYILKDWMVQLPDGEVESKRVANDLRHSYTAPDQYEYEVDMDQVGIYRVAAIVSYDGQIDMLMHIVEVKETATIAQEHATTIGELKPGDFDAFRMQYVIAANLASLKMTAYAEKEGNDKSEIKILGHENPMMIAGYQNMQNFGIDYELQTKTDTRQVWYIIPDAQYVLPIRSNYNGVSRFMDIKGVHEHELANGQKAYSPYTELKPEDRKKINLPFPAIVTPDFPDMRYRIIAEEYNRADVLVAAHEYYQYFRSAESFEYKKLKAERDAANEQLNRINEFSAKISGDVHPLKAVYVNEETGNSLQIELFYGTDKADDSEIRLLDLTLGVAKSDYTGDDLDDALDSYNYRNSYPDGKLYIYFEDKTVIITTNGGSLVERFTTWTGWLSTLAFVGGVAAMLTGFEPAALVLFKAGLIAGAVSSLGSIVSQLDKDVINPAMIAVEVLSIASMITAKAAMAMRLKAVRDTSIRAARSSARLFAVAGFMDGGGVFLMTSESMSQLNAVLDDKSLTSQERQSKIALLLSGMLLNGLFFAFSHEDVMSTKNELKSKGVPEGKIAGLDEVALLKVNQLTKEEIEWTLRNGQDLLTAAEVKAERLLLEQEKRAVNDVFVNRMFDKFKMKRKEVVQVRKGVYDKPDREIMSADDVAVYTKELDFAEEICANERREIVMTQHKEPAVDGFDLNTGVLIQLKELEAYNKLMGRINEAYASGKAQDFKGIELYVKFPSTKSSALIQYNKGLKESNRLLQNDQTISHIIVYCSDGKFELQLPK